MSRRRASNPFDTQEEPELDMSPLIDVAFLLLIYFIVSTSLMKQEADLGLTLPGAAATSGEPIKIDQMIVKVRADSSILVNDEPLPTPSNPRDLSALMDRIGRYEQTARMTGSEAMVIVDCADEAPEQRFVDVLNACAASGIEKVSLMR